MSPVNPFDPTTFTEGGLRGVIACDGAVKEVYCGGGTPYNYPGEVFVVVLGDVNVTKHEDPTLVGSMEEYSVLHGIDTTKGRTWSKVVAVYAAKGLTITADGRNFGSESKFIGEGKYAVLGGKHIFYEKVLTNTWVDRDSGEKKEAKALLPTKVGAAGAPPRATARTAVATPAEGFDIPEELAATLVGLASGKTAKEFASAVVTNTETRKAKLGAAARTGKLLEWMVGEGMVEIGEDGKIA